MGDRVNVRFVQEEETPAVWFYSRWGGFEMPAMLQKALAAAESRWHDPPYGCRIVICSLIGKDNWDSKTGVGISTTVPDNAHDLLEVNFVLQQIRLFKNGPTYDEFAAEPARAWAFSEYLEIPEVSWDALNETINSEAA